MNAASWGVTVSGLYSQSLPNASGFPERIRDTTVLIASSVSSLVSSYSLFCRTPGGTPPFVNQRSPYSCACNPSPNEDANCVIGETPNTRPGTVYAGICTSDSAGMIWPRTRQIGSVNEPRPEIRLSWQLTQSGFSHTTFVGYSLRSREVINPNALPRSSSDETQRKIQSHGFPGCAPCNPALVNSVGVGI